MGWRFRKSVKIFPGVRANFGKGGFTSLSVGGKYAKTNISKRGTYNTYNLPGGFSYRTKTQRTDRSQQEPNRYVKPMSEVIWVCSCSMINSPDNPKCDGCNIINPKLFTLKNEPNQPQADEQSEFQISPSAAIVLVAILTLVLLIVLIAIY